ncbi:MAG: hypothetical protein ABW208_10075 [Pyrinomonadaceae bacterium]
MKRGMLLASTLLALAALVAGAAAEVSPPNVASGEPSDERIRFQITAVEEGAAGRKVISDAAVEGPAGTDFNVNLQDGRFRMSAKFSTDLATGGDLTLRARLETRRLHGYSEAGLPLYEEDAQRHTLRVGFDEAVVLLPFGGGGDGGRLSIEIKPARAGRQASGVSTAPEITISKPSPGGAISVEATKVPHDFVVEATLLEDGREVARGAADSLLEEPGELLLRPNGAAGEGAAVPLALNLTVERFEPGAGSGRAAVRFDLFGDDPARAGTRTTLARNWAGVASLGSDLIYDLSQTYRGVQGKRYELKLRINLASADKADRRD